MPIPKIWKELLKKWKIADDYNEIQVIPDLTDEKGVPIKGFCDTDNKIIKLDLPMVQTESLEGVRTILHEANHQFLDTIFGEEIRSRKEMERLADFGSLTTLQLMLDNTSKFQEILNLIKRRKKWAERKTKTPRKPRSRRNNRKKQQ